MNPYSLSFIYGMKKKIWFVGVLLFCYSISAQTKQNLGVVFGITHFQSNTDAFETESVTGITFGVNANFIYSPRSELNIGLRYNRHLLDFKGTESDNEKVFSEKVRLNLKQFEVPITYTYNIVSRQKFKLGLNAGVSGNFFYEYRLHEDDQEHYYLAPNGIDVNNLFFGTKDDKVGFNLFLVGGLSFRFWEKIQFTFRYHDGLFNPYRQATPENPLSDYEAKDHYFSSTFTFFL